MSYRNRAVALYRHTAGLPRADVPRFGVSADPDNAERSTWAD